MVSSNLACFPLVGVPLDPRSFSVAGGLFVCLDCVVGGPPADTPGCFVEEPTQRAWPCIILYPFGDNDTYSSRSLPGV